MDTKQKECAANAVAETFGAYLETVLSDEAKELLLTNDECGGAVEMLLHSSMQGSFLLIVAADRSGARAILHRQALRRPADPALN